MASISFDTHKFIRRLQQAGVSEAQAEAIVDAFREAYGEAELATKRDLRALGRNSRRASRCAGAQRTRRVVCPMNFRGSAVVFSD